MLGEIIQWMISAIQEVPKLPSARNNLVSSTFLTAENFSRYLNNSNEYNEFTFVKFITFFIKKQFVYSLPSFLYTVFIQTNGKNSLPQPLLHANEAHTSISNSFGCGEYFANVF